MVNKEKLKYYRELNNYKLYTLARMMKCPKKVLKNWEEGLESPTALELEKLAGIYNVDIEELLIVNNNSHCKYFSLVLFVVGILFGLILNDYGIMIISPILLILTCYFGYNINKLRKEISEEITSLFGINLLMKEKKKRVVIYIIEGLFIAGCAINIMILIRLFNISFLMFYIKIINIEFINTIILYSISYLLLSIITFIIEFCFSEMMIKKYLKEVKK